MQPMKMIAAVSMSVVLMGAHFGGVAEADIIQNEGSAAFGVQNFDTHNRKAVGQSFTATAAEPDVTSVLVDISAADAQQGGTVNARLYATDPLAPEPNAPDTSQQLAIKTLPLSGMDPGLGTFETFTFPSPVPLATGTKYFIQIDYDNNANPGAQIGVRGYETPPTNAVDNYTGGLMLIREGANYLLHDGHTTDDLAFGVVSTIPEPTAAAIVLAGSGLAMLRRRSRRPA